MGIKKKIISAGLAIGILTSMIGGTTVSASMYGDVDKDGKVDISDLVLMQKYIAGWKNLNINKNAADLNFDGQVDLSDLVIMQKIISGWKFDINANLPTKGIYQGKTATCVTTSITMLVNSEKNTNWDSDRVAWWTWRKGYFTQDLSVGARVPVKNINRYNFGDLGMYATEIPKVITEYGKEYNNAVYTVKNDYIDEWDTQSRYYKGNKPIGLKQIKNDIKEKIIENINDKKRTLVMICSGGAGIVGTNPYSGHAIVICGYYYNNKLNSYTFKFKDPLSEDITKIYYTTDNELTDSMIAVTNAEYGALVSFAS